MPITHAKVSAVPDVGDPSLIEPSDWNADHSVPTLTEVLVAGNDVGSATITGSAAAFGGSPILDLSSSPDATLIAGDGINDGSDQPGGTLDLRGGATSPIGGSPAQGARLVIEGGGYDAQLSGGGFRLITASGGADGNPNKGGDVSFQIGGGNGGGRDGLIFLNLPTSDPGVSGALWNNGGVVTVS